MLQAGGGELSLDAFEGGLRCQVSTHMRSQVLADMPSATSGSLHSDGDRNAFAMSGVRSQHILVWSVCASAGVWVALA